MWLWTQRDLVLRRELEKAHLTVTNRCVLPTMAGNWLFAHLPWPNHLGPMSNWINKEKEQGWSGGTSAWFGGTSCSNQSLCRPLAKASFNQVTQRPFLFTVDEAHTMFRKQLVAVRLLISSLNRNEKPPPETQSKAHLTASVGLYHSKMDTHLFLPADCVKAVL